ncbi:MAG: HIT family protein [Candidatus Woesearchaeota archaeon]
MEDCIFCKIVKGDIPSTKVYEDEYSAAFMDIMPAVKGHTLVIPKNHHETYLDIPYETLENMAKTIKKVAFGVIKAMSATGYKIEIFNGESAGQAVKHAHFHIVPRYENDDLKYREDKNWWVPKKELYSEGEIEEIADSIRKNMA